ncbi:MAG: hypothetical protein DME26_08855 [Verrucomicrobia bacterium]|nr:MAG: hypothetical protein DME26_08855 [Verrucomicrobiota bacterium]
MDASVCLHDNKKTFDFKSGWHPKLVRLGIAEYYRAGKTTLTGNGVKKRSISGSSLERNENVSLSPG